MRRFGYCRDPAFLVSGLLYLLNRFCIASRWGEAAPFFTSHFADVLLLPCALPVLLWLQRVARLRTHDFQPTHGEIGGTLVLWMLLFEFVFPRLFGRGVGDPLDLLAYASGALLAKFAWAWQHRGAPTTHHSRSLQRNGWATTFEFSIRHPRDLPQ